MKQLSGNKIKVKYTGKAPQVFVEYNRVRYVFFKKRPIVEIPVEVYDYFKIEGDTFVSDITPVQQIEEKVKGEEPEQEKKVEKVEKKRKIKFMNGGCKRETLKEKS